MKAQTIFYRVVRHLLTQGEKSTKVLHGYGNEQCVYKNPDGLKCAVGCLITDKEYTPEMEGKTVDGLFASYPNLAERLGKENFHLLNGLQLIHDHRYPKSWKRSLQNYAVLHNLKFPRRFA